MGAAWSSRVTNEEVAVLYRAAQTELNANEQAMLISPLALADLIDMLWARDRRLAALSQYDELHDA